MPKRFLDKKCYKYTLLSDHYDSNDVLGNRTGKFFAAFFDKFSALPRKCQARTR